MNTEYMRSSWLEAVANGEGEGFARNYMPDILDHLDEARAERDALKAAVAEWKAAASGRTLSCVCDSGKRIKELEAECLEQARLNGMGANREAKLLAERDALKAKVAAYKKREVEYLDLARRLEAQAAKMAEALKGLLSEARDVGLDEWLANRARGNAALPLPAQESGKPKPWCENHDLPHIWGSPACELQKEKDRKETP